MDALEKIDGVPAVISPRVRCGQCAYVCPAQARRLVSKENEQIPYLLDWMNQGTMHRYGKGMWPKLEG